MEFAAATVWWLFKAVAVIVGVYLVLVVLAVGWWVLKWQVTRRWWR